MKLNRPIKFITTIFAIGITATLIGGSVLINHHNERNTKHELFTEQGQTTEATVTDVTRDPTIRFFERRSNYFYPTITYETKTGDKYEKTWEESALISEFKYRKGDVFEIMYLESDPTQTLLIGDKATDRAWAEDKNIVYLTITGLITIAAGIYSIVITGSNRKEQGSLKNTPIAPEV